MWRRDVILAVILLIILIVLLLCLAICACRKAQSRKETFLKRKEFVRDSLRRSQHQHQKQKSAVELTNKTTNSKIYWPNDVPPPPFSSTSRSSSSLTSASAYTETSTATTTNRNSSRNNSHKDILKTDKYSSNNLSLQQRVNNNNKLDKGIKISRYDIFLNICCKMIWVVLASNN